MNRNITINLSREDMLQIAETIESWEKLWMAIGYLSTCILSYPNVTVFRDGDTDMVAMYYVGDRADKPAYVIGAVWHDDHYGFHS